MEWLHVVGVVLIGLVLRLGVPVGVTALLVLWLRWLDARWQREADEQKARVLDRVISVTAMRPCWEVMNCPPERRMACPVFHNGNQPCWQVFRDPDGRLKEACLQCKVFREAPIPLAV